jgi:hypothetical protein
MHATTIGVFHQRNAAEQAVDALRKKGIRDSSIAFRQPAESWRESRVVSATASGALIGAAIGALAGWAAAADVLPDLSSIFFATILANGLGFTGATATVMSGVFTGLITAAVVGLAIGLATREPVELEQEEIASRTNGDAEIVVTTHTDNPEAQKILRSYGADDVHEYTAAR